MGNMIGSVNGKYDKVYDINEVVINLIYYGKSIPKPMCTFSNLLEMYDIALNHYIAFLQKSEIGEPLQTLIYKAIKSSKNKYADPDGHIARYYNYVDLYSSHDYAIRSICYHL